MKLVLALLFAAHPLFGDAGTLIPMNKTAPDPAILSMEEMAIDIWIDRGSARVQERQIFASHALGVQEANYTFALPGRAMVSDFAVWDGVVRIPGVILERKRAEQMYEFIKQQSIDPGLLQMGERDADQARRGAIFTARIVPIMPHSMKRVEMEYHEPVPVEDLKSVFAIPLRPDAYRVQRVGRLFINLHLQSDHPIKDFQIGSKTYAAKVVERTPNSIKVSYDARNVDLSEDFTINYSFDGARGDKMEVSTYRESSGPGFFKASALLLPPTTGPATARTVVALFDNSLSMQWEKLERNFQALETTLKSLHPPDSFNLALFNTDVTPFSPSPVEASTANIEKALEFVRNSRLRGGTNLQAALEFGLKQGGVDPHLVLFTDGGATQGIISTGKLAAWYSARWNQLAAAQRPRTFVFAVGDDANSGLLKLLARNGGLMEWVRSTEQIDFKLSAFIAKIGRKPVDGLNLTMNNPANFDFVYPLQDVVYRGSMASWVGQYKQPAQATFTAGAMSATVALPALKTDSVQLPRAWAKARVDALLEKIDRDGEDSASIEEIIRLSRKYKFVTPYTSFLAAPRALLRPRLIRPGDPVLRVKTDPSVTSVVALFPFGLVKKLRYLPDEDTWQTRFLAPPTMTDGTYQVRLIMRDRNGAAYRETKSFVIASKPPVVKVKLEKTRYQHGETVKLRSTASSTTRTSVARMYGITPVSLRWNDQESANLGQFVIPAQLPAGRYTLTVTAEDFAHNIGSQEVQIEVAP